MNKLIWQAQNGSKEAPSKPLQHKNPSKNPPASERRSSKKYKKHHPAISGDIKNTGSSQKIRLIILIVIIAVVILLLSPVFHIKTLEITKMESLSREEILNILDIHEGDHFFKTLSPSFRNA